MDTLLALHSIRSHMFYIYIYMCVCVCEKAALNSVVNFDSFQLMC